jgi:chromosome segregation ATPase
MSLATKEVLAKELKRYQERVEFLDKWIELIKTNEYETDLDRFESENRIYSLQGERDFKQSLIEQRESQINQINQQEELKKKVVEEFDSKLDEALKKRNQIAEDLEKVKKIVVPKDQKKNKASEVKNMENLLDQVDTIYNGIEDRYNADNNHESLVNDFRQLQEIINIG